MDPNATNPLVQSTVDDSGTRVDLFADGTQVETYDGGGTVTRHPDGRTVQRSQGYTTVVEPDGTQTTIPPPPGPTELPYEMRDWRASGRPVHDDNSIHVWHHDREEVTYASGQVEVFYRDGRTVRYPPPPPRQGPIAPDGTPHALTVTATDGSVLHVDPDGRRTYTYRPGMDPEELPTNRGFTPPPPVEFTDADGTRHVHEADGTHRIIEDGVETVIPRLPLRDGARDRDVHRTVPADENAMQDQPDGTPLVFGHYTGGIDRVQNDGTAVSFPPIPPHVFPLREGQEAPRVNRTSVQPDGTIVREVEDPVFGGTHSTGTLVSRPDGSHVLTRTDGTMVYTAPDGTQHELPRGSQAPGLAVPTPAVPSAPSPERPRGCSAPVVAAVGTILTLIGVGVVLGRQLSDDSSEDEVAAAVEDCVGAGAGAGLEPGDVVLVPAQSCPDTETTTTLDEEEDETTTTLAPAPPAAVRDDWVLTSEFVSNNGAVGTACGGGQTPFTLRVTDSAFDFDFDEGGGTSFDITSFVIAGQVLSSERGSDDSFTLTVTYPTPNGTRVGISTIEGQFDFAADPPTAAGTHFMDFGDNTSCDFRFTAVLVG